MGIDVNKLKHTLFDKRITIHPNIARAYGVLSLSAGIMAKLTSRYTLNKPIHQNHTLPLGTGEQALMKALFLELMSEQTEKQTISYYLSKYYYLSFVQAMISNGSLWQDDKLDEFALNEWLYQQITAAGVQYEQKRTLAEQAQTCDMLKTAMKAVLDTPAYQDNFESPGWFWLATKITVGLFMLGMSASAFPYILDGKAIFLLLVACYGTAMTIDAALDICAPTLDTPQPHVSAPKTLVINQWSLDLVPAEKADSSFGTYWPKQAPTHLDL